jgi:hypothetical protein
VKFVKVKQFFPLLFCCYFVWSEIRDKGWIKIRIQDKLPLSATLHTRMPTKIMASLLFSYALMLSLTPSLDSQNRTVYSLMDNNNNNKKLASVSYWHPTARYYMA